MASFLGAGAAPAGSSPAGFGTPATAAALTLPAAPTTALIDPTAKDYTYDANGNRTQGTRAQQMVYLACLTARDSSCLSDFGLDRTPGTITSNIQAQRLAAYTRAFAPLAAAGVAALIGVDVQRETPTRVIERVRWQDLTTLEESQIQFE